MHFAPVLELVDWHGSEPCARKGVGVQVSPGAFNFFDCQIMINSLKLVVVIVAALSIISCNRIPSGYAGNPKVKNAPAYTVEPKLHVPVK